MKFKERINKRDIYICALELAEAGIINKESRGLCFYLEQILLSKGFGLIFETETISYTQMICNIFPEFALFKPLVKVSRTRVDPKNYWFPDDMKTRLIVLELCILMCED